MIKIVIFALSFALGWSVAEMIKTKSRKWTLIALLLAMVWFTLAMKHLGGF